jgi:hypothetical protein
LATALGNDANFATTVSTSIGNRVPYTGANADVVLGTNNLKSKNTFVEGDGSYNGGGLRIKQYVSQADGIDNYNTISSQSSGFAFSSSFGGGIFKNFILDASSLTNTTQRVYTLPNASGTLALTSNLSSYLPLAGGTLTGALNIRYNGGTSVDAVIRLRGTNATARTTRLQFEDYNGTIADGIIEFKIPTAGTASSATLSMGVNGAGLTFDINNTAAFSNNVGIGATPSYLLDVYTASSATTSTVLRLRNGYNDPSTGLRMRWDFASIAGAYLDVITDSGGSKSMYLSLSSANAAPTQVFQIVGSTGAATFSNSITSAGLNLNSGGVININTQNGFQLGADSSSGGFYVYDNTNAVYRLKISNAGATVLSGALTIGGALTTSNPLYSSSGTPLTFTNNGNSGTYTQTTIYVNQTNTSGTNSNGIFIERGRLSDSGSAEVRHFIIGQSSVHVFHVYMHAHCPPGFRLRAQFSLSPSLAARLNGTYIRIQR